MNPICKNMLVTRRHQSPASVKRAEFAPQCSSSAVVGSVIETPASAIPRNTATLIPKIPWVTVRPALVRIQGVGITRWTASCATSPRCAASCCTHQGHSLLRKVKGESCRPHWRHFAIQSEPERAVCHGFRKLGKEKCPDAEQK